MSATQRAGVVAHAGPSFFLVRRTERPPGRRLCVKSVISRNL